MATPLHMITDLDELGALLDARRRTLFRLETSTSTRWLPTARTTGATSIASPNRNGSASNRG